MKKSFFMFIFLAALNSSQARTHGELSFVKVVKTSLRLQKELSKFCREVPYGTEEVYNEDAYVLRVPFNGKPKAVDVKVMNLVLSVSVRNGYPSVLNVVRFLPSVVDLDNAYYKFEGSVLEVYIPLKKGERRQPVNCYECLTRVAVLEEFPKMPRVKSEVSGDDDDQKCYL